MPCIVEENFKMMQEAVATGATEPNKLNSIITLGLGLNSYMHLFTLGSSLRFFGTNCSSSAHIWSFVIVISFAWHVKYASPSLAFKPELTSRSSKSQRLE